jgi:AraC family transcriptional regulator
MRKSGDDMSATFNVRNLSCRPLILMLKEKLQDIGFVVIDITFGRITLKLRRDTYSEELLSTLLQKYEMDLILEREAKLVEEIKNAIHELIHDLNNMDSIIRRSDFLVEKLGYSYAYLSRIFSRHEHITLEKYIIGKKIDRIKELILQDEYTLSEIAYMMGYSSVQYLSNQFRNITGENVSTFRQQHLSS